MTCRILNIRWAYVALSISIFAIHKDNSPATYVAIVPTSLYKYYYNCEWTESAPRLATAIYKTHTIIIKENHCNLLKPEYLIQWY